MPVLPNTVDVMPLSETERTGEDARNESEERGAGQRLDAREMEGGRESATPTERATVRAGGDDRDRGRDVVRC